MACKCGSKRSRIAALASRPASDDRPSGGFDNAALFGSMQSQGAVPLQGDVWWGSLSNRDTRPMPAEVIVPVIVGFNPIPLETPVYDRGSLFRDDDWERP